jgi:uncharacterized LabA/DUF88 family protein
MIRVALYLDGKNHMRDLRHAAPDRWIDHGALARWVVTSVGGTELAAAHYYTGVPNPADEPQPRSVLHDLLEELERLPGFFTHRYMRHHAKHTCTACGVTETYTREKLVDTSLVSDVVLHAAQDRYDIAVILSGDLDLMPAIEAAHSLGKRAWLATFGSGHVHRKLRDAAWGQLDLSMAMETVGRPVVDAGVRAGPVEPGDDVLVRELGRAEKMFAASGGFVGSQYFLNRWRGGGLTDDALQRRAILDRLIAAGAVEVYEIEGKSALRVGAVAVHAETAD